MTVKFDARPDKERATDSAARVNDLLGVARYAPVPESADDPIDAEVPEEDEDES